jgi:hypothetical protein
MDHLLLNDALIQVILGRYRRMSLILDGSSQERAQQCQLRWLLARDMVALLWRVGIEELVLATG